MDILFPEEGLTKEMEEALEKAGDLCVSGEGLDPGECQVSLSLVSPEQIRQLNEQFRGKDEVTDVLSFPQYDFNETREEEIIFDGDLLLGDVVLCMERAEEQAREYGHGLLREVTYLFVHSMLHLLGYDHMEDEDREEMRTREKEIMSELGIGR